MSFWDEYSIRWAWVCCFFLLFISLIAQSWLFFGLTVLIFLSSTADTWMWWLPGMSRKEKFGIRLEGASQRKLKTETPSEWMAQAVGYFRGLGFFAGDRDLDDEAVAGRIAEGHLNERGIPFDASAPDADLHLVATDPLRAWKMPLDLEAKAGQLVYTPLLQEWSRISVGSFRPEDISEFWETDEGPILLEFTHDRRRHMIEARYLEGDFDLHILGPINELIEESGRRFEMIEGADRSLILLLCITPEERRRLVADRWWKFW